MNDFDLEKWLPGKDSNLDKMLQRHLCYRYTTGQRRAQKIIILNKMSSFSFQSLIIFIFKFVNHEMPIKVFSYE